VTRQVELAVGAVVLHHDHVLLVRRATPPAAGRWSFPGGRVEPGERMADDDAADARWVHLDEISTLALVDGLLDFLRVNRALD
jgi:8-oxo-dGTP diphosphatase